MHPETEDGMTLDQRAGQAITIAFHIKVNTQKKKNTLDLVEKPENLLIRMPQRSKNRHRLRSSTSRRRHSGHKSLSP